MIKKYSGKLLLSFCWFSVIEDFLRLFYYFNDLVTSCNIVYFGSFSCLFSSFYSLEGSLLSFRERRRFWFWGVKGRVFIFRFSYLYFWNIGIGLFYFFV